MKSKANRTRTMVCNIDDVISGTASDASDGVGQNVVLDEEEDDGEAVIGEAKLIASLTIGQDHEINFVEIEEEAGRPNVLVSETHRPSSLSALEQLAELGRKGVTAHDVFYAMSEGAPRFRSASRCSSRA